MKRLLVIVDGTIQASLALDEALEIAQAAPRSEIVLLSIAPPATSWQRHRPLDPNRTKIAERVAALALGRARQAGVTARARLETGDEAEVAAKVAREENCDHIFMPQRDLTPVARALLAVTGLSTTSPASRIQSLSQVPITVVSHHDGGHA